MPNARVRISLADLSAAGLGLQPTEAATIARDLALRVARGGVPGIPSSHVIRLDGTGTIHVEGPVSPDREVQRAARLLEKLLPSFDAPPEMRAPGALRLVIARALGTLDLPPYASLDDFAEALTRFAAVDTAACVAGVVAGWQAAAECDTEASPAGADESCRTVVESKEAETGELTISDLRRARRATRLTLADVSERTRIPVALLREFEWGYFANWPSGFYGRTQMVRYARAAGLDERVVVQTVLPLLDAAARERTADPVSHEAGLALVPVAAQLYEPAQSDPGTSLVLTTSSVLADTRRTGPSRRTKWAAALAIPALVAIGLVPAAWSSRSSSDDQSQVVPVAAARPKKARARDVMTAAPTAPVPVTTAGYSPAFATTGSAMFYHGDAREGSALMRADTDGSGAVLRVTSILDDSARNFHVRPSPDGSRIAFDSDRDGERGVYVADANGRNVRRVSGSGFAAVPSWSPDGRQLAVVRAEAGQPDVWNIWTTDLATGASRRLTAHRVGQPWGAAWFPDGDRIAYSHETRLIVRALDGSSQRIFNSPIPGKMIRTPAIAPDGKRIIFQVHRNGAWILDLRDGRMRRVLADPSAEEFTWAPDGRRVAYHSRQTGAWGVWVMAGDDKEAGS